MVATEPSQNRHGMIGGTQREGETEDPRRILTIYKAASIHWWSVLKLEGSGVVLKRGSWRRRYAQRSGGHGNLALPKSLGLLGKTSSQKTVGYLIYRSDSMIGAMANQSKVSPSLFN